MNEKELEALLAETLGADAQRPNYLDTRLRGELSAARETGRGLSLWWLPLALTVGVCLPMFLLGVLMPWPMSMMLQVAAISTVVAAAIFTGVGLACFDLKEKGRVLL